MERDRNRYMTAQDVADLYHVNIRTVWRWRDSGKLKEARRAGRAVLFDREQVEALGGGSSDTITLADVYKRLVGIESWEQVWNLRDEIAATLCSRADQEGQEAISASWSAACSMAATHPDEAARERWTNRARTLGGYIGKSWADTDEAIVVREGRSYEEARQEADAAPYDPVYKVASIEARR